MKSGSRTAQSLPEGSIRDVYARKAMEMQVPSFEETWRAAKLRVSERTRDSGRWMSVGSLAAASGLVLTFSLWVLLPREEIEPSPALTPEITSLKTIDPNLPWYAPTDELLQVGVLRYASTWPVYEQFYFVTVEIH